MDIPLIRESSVHSLTARFKQNPEHIIIPEFNKEPGHPPLIPAWLIPKILDLKTDSNLGKLLLSLQNYQKKRMVHDHGILMDADNKKAYEDLKKRYQTIDIPDKKECHSIIQEYLKGEKSIKAHVEMVAKTAITLAREIQAQPSEHETSKYTLDMNLILAGALLHDIKRKEPNHAAVGAQLILSLGFPKVADTVSQHMDLTLPITDYLTEAQIVYFADKLCNGAKLDLNYDKRFTERIKHTPHARNIILKRYEHTQLIQARIESLVKKPVKSILSKIYMKKHFNQLNSFTLCCEASQAKRPNRPHGRYMKILNSYEPGSKRFQADLANLYSNNDSLIYLLRHGRIEGHGTKRFIGQTDVFLDDLGKSQAKKWHKALGSIHFKAVYSSSLQRCFHTAQLVCPQQKIKLDSRLNEINMGEWDGKSFDEIKKKRVEEFEKRGSEIYQFRPANGESFKDLSDRIFPFFNSLKTAALKHRITHGQKNPCSKILIVTHAGVIRLLICRILEMNPEDLFKIKLAYGELFVLKIEHTV